MAVSRSDRAATPPSRSVLPVIELRRIVHLPSRHTAFASTTWSIPNTLWSLRPEEYLPLRLGGKCGSRLEGPSRCRDRRHERIGRRAADIFADEGANVAICARNADEVKAVVAGLKAKGVGAFGEALDVADRAALERFVADAAKALGGVDVLVANVSALAAQGVLEDWQKAFDVDMMHTVYAVNAAIPPSRKIQPSFNRLCLVGVGSRGRFRGARIWRHEGGTHSLCAAPCVRAGSEDDPADWCRPETPISTVDLAECRKNLPDLYAKALARNPTGRMATPEEIGRGIVFLASPASSFTTGTNLVIDGRSRGACSCDSSLNCRASLSDRMLVDGTRSKWGAAILSGRRRARVRIPQWRS